MAQLLRYTVGIAGEPESSYSDILMSSDVDTQKVIDEWVKLHDPGALFNLSSVKIMDVNVAKTNPYS